jgi:hypothetical protein
MVYMSLPLAGMAGIVFPIWLVNKIFDETQNEFSRRWHRLPASCTPYPSQILPESHLSIAPKPTATTALGVAAALAAGLVSFRVQHGLLWHRLFFYQMEGAGSRDGRIEGFGHFLRSFAPPIAATYFNVFASAMPAAIVKSLVDGPGPHAHLRFELAKDELKSVAVWQNGRPKK